MKEKIPFLEAPVIWQRAKKQTTPWRPTFVRDVGGGSHPDCADGT